GPRPAVHLGGTPAGHHDGRSSAHPAVPEPSLRHRFIVRGHGRRRSRRSGLQEPRSVRRVSLQPRLHGRRPAGQRVSCEGHVPHRSEQSLRPHRDLCAMVRPMGRAVMALAVVLVATSSHAGGPTDRLNQYAKTAQQSPAGASGSSNASSIFAVDEMAERVLGRHWPDRTAKERAEFTPLFGTLLDRVYLSQIGRYTGDRLRYTSEVIDGARATVRANVRPRPGEELPITMTMRI